MIITRNNKIIAIINNHELTKTADEGRHLLHKFGGVPAIDAVAWDKHRDEVERITISTKSEVFTVSAETFDKNKKEINYGSYGRQYYIERELWSIKSRTTTGSFSTSFYAPNAITNSTRRTMPKNWIAPKRSAPEKPKTTDPSRLL